MTPQYLDKCSHVLKDIMELGTEENLTIGRSQAEPESVHILTKKEWKPKNEAVETIPKNNEVCLIA
ncbi:hypothetical protein A2U01_0066439, partial [Trifolium medium]|nr:hypothetical protein [Trifolium medium]